MHVLTTAPRLSRWAQVLRQPAPRSPLTREALRSEVVPNHALRKRIEEHEIELDRTLERVAQALEARAEEELARSGRDLGEISEELASARAEISRLQRQLSRVPAGLADEGEGAREDASSGGAGRARRASSSIGAMPSSLHTSHESPAARGSSKRLRGQPAAEEAAPLDPATGRDSGPVLRKRRRS
jgi:hypothetical protein